MKKLMFAVAALAAGVACAEITSANIVGYTTIETRASGSTMLTPTFVGVTSDVQCTLADLSVTGYSAPSYDEEEEEWVGGCNGAFVINFLTSTGTNEATYKWYDNGVKTGWYDGKGAAISGGAASVIIEAGKAMWIQGKGYSLVSAGAVKATALVYATRSSGSTSCGNGLPVDTTLSKLTVNGYTAPSYDEEEEEWVGGCNGAFVLNILSSSGTNEATYKWYDNGVKTGWYDGKGAAIDADSVIIPAGQGFWIQGKGLNLVIPAVL